MSLTCFPCRRSPALPSRLPPDHDRAECPDAERADFLLGRMNRRDPAHVAQNREHHAVDVLPRATSATGSTGDESTMMKSYCCLSCSKSVRTLSWASACIAWCRTCPAGITQSRPSDVGLIASRPSLRHAALAEAGLLRHIDRPCARPDCGGRRRSASVFRQARARLAASWVASEVLPSPLSALVTMITAGSPCVTSAAGACGWRRRLRSADFATGRFAAPRLVPVASHLAGMAGGNRRCSCPGHVTLRPGR